MAMGPKVESEAEVLEPHDLSKPSARKRLAISIVTPMGSVLAKDVDEIVAPGVEGEFGVLPGHVAFLSALRPGVLVVRDQKQREVFAVASGYLQVAGAGQVRVLVDRAERPDDIDVAEVRNEKAGLEEQLRALAHAAPKAPSDHGAGAVAGATAAAPPAGQRELDARLAWANARLAAAQAASTLTHQ